MPYHLSSFISARLSPGLQSQLSQLPGFPASLTHCLLAGPERSGKTSILFHFAYTLAAAGKQVGFLCKRSKLEQVPPLLPLGANAQDAAWQNINLRYLDTAADLQKYAACIHLSPNPPQALIVDDLSEFIVARPGERAHDQEIVKTLAFLHEAARCASPGQAEPCLLLVSDLSGAEGPRALYLYQRWLPLIIHIRPEGGLVLGLLPQVAELHAVPVKCMAQLHFCLAGQSALSLEYMTFPS
ncbi:hypothetical protein WJX72_000412 [[Myrmecia] bisecta]|uniref:Uncharacterized protein n=1 Tax=[Myrmecia] bisecta TaxID=41462 RepID=A0AAW1Q0X3_9CHLO